MMLAPRIDLQEADGELRVHADMPGVAPADLDLRVDGDVLTIRGERKSSSERNEQNYHVMERSHGRFQRSIQLPFAPDPQDVQAEMREGVLEVRIPKRPTQERNRRIQVRDAGSSTASTGSTNGGSTNGGSTNGGSTNGGSTNGGSMHGGSMHGGSMHGGGDANGGGASGGSASGSSGGSAAAGQASPASSTSGGEGSAAGVTPSGSSAASAG